MEATSDPLRPSVTRSPRNGVMPGARIDRYERAARVLTGGALMLYGASRGTVLGLAVAAGGAVFAYRGLTGRRAVGRRLAIPRALDVQRTIVLGTPAESIYPRLRDVSAWPRFFPNLTGVEARNGRVYRVGIRLGPLYFDDEVEITREQPGRRFEWRARPDAELFHRGELEVVPAGPGCELRLRVELLPPGGAAALPFHDLLEHRAATFLTGALDRLQQQLEPTRK